MKSTSCVTRVRHYLCPSLDINDELVAAVLAIAILQE